MRDPVTRSGIRHMTLKLPDLSPQQIGRLTVSITKQGSRLGRLRDICACHERGAILEAIAEPHLTNYVRHCKHNYLLVLRRDMSGKVSTTSVKSARGNVQKCKWEAHSVLVALIGYGTTLRNFSHGI
jgi:hypothetical protein